MKALSFGEILFDVIGDTEHLGGAPFNLAAHLSRLGNEASIVSAVGRDERGDKIMAEIKRLGVGESYMQTNEFPTGYVQVEIDEAGKPTYTIHENVAYDNICDINLDNEFNCFCFGTLTQRNQVSRDSLYKILENTKIKQVFYDVNLRQNYYSLELIEASLQYATIVKLNDEEVLVLSQLLFQEDLSEANFVKKIIDKYNLQIVIVTRGGEGCAVYSQDEKVEVPGIKIIIKDTVGAGDAFSAGFLHKYFETGNLGESAKFANELGAYVASRAGAIPEDD